MTTREHKTGFTLIEVLVVIAVLALVIGIAIPAVMGAKEAARRLQCQNNLKQLGIASNLHLDAKNYYPREENSYSAFVSMLPYLEQKSLYNHFNLSMPRDLAYGPTDVNYTAYSTTVSTFVCPSNNSIPTPLGPNSYGGNLGTGAGRYGRPENGPFASSSLDPKILAALVRDGLSNTIAMSEFCRTQGRSSSRNNQSIFQIGSYTVKQYETMTTECSGINIREQPIAPLFRGFCWAFDGLTDSSYDHNLSPNSHTCTCTAGALSGVWTASSNHPSGVNCVSLDGHVSFVQDTVSVAAWRAMGTMNGGEIVSNKTN